MKLGFVGTGTIATAVVHSLAPHGHDIHVSERSRANAAALAARYPSVHVAANQIVVDQSDVIFLGLLPDVAEKTLPGLKFRPNQKVISFIAGIGLDKINEMVAPASAVALMLPYPNIVEPGSVIPMLGDKALISRLFAPQHQIVLLNDEQEMAAVLCAQAVLSPVALLVKTATDWLENAGVDRARGEPFLRGLVASNLKETETRTLLSALNTEGGFNQRLREHMERSGMEGALLKGLDHLLAQS